MKIQRRTFVLGAAAALASPRLVLAQADTYAVGGLFPMSGPTAEGGAIYTKAVQLAIEHMDKDKWLKRRIDFKVQDSLGTPQGGAVGMTRLANVEQVVYTLIGVTGVSKAAAPIGERAKVMMVNGGGVGPDLEGLSPYFWSVIPLVTQEVVALVPWIKTQNLKRIAVIYVDDALGQGVLKELTARLPAAGSSLVAAYNVAPDAQQFASIAAKLRNDQPDAIYIASPGINQIVQIIKQLRDAGVNQRLLTYGAGNFPSITKLPESEGMVFTSQAADWVSQEPVMKRFVEGWRGKYQTEPTTYGLNYYNGALLFGHLARGLEKSNTPVNGATLREELLRVRRFALAGGEVSFGERGTVNTNMQINRISKGASERIA